MAMVSGSAGERFAAEAAAPGLVLAPGRAVGAAGAVAAGAGGVDRGAAGQLFELGRVGGAVGHGERTEQGGLQGQGPRPDRPGRPRRGLAGSGGGGAAAGAGRGLGAGGGVAVTRSLARVGGRSAAWRGPGSSWRVMAASLERLFSVRKAGLSDGTAFPACSRGS